MFGSLWLARFQVFTRQGTRSRKNQVCEPIYLIRYIFTCMNQALPNWRFM